MTEPLRSPTWEDASAAEAADAELAALAMAGAPLRRAQARIAGRMVARRGWEPLGFVRAADYARERLGFSARELQDLARVDAALEGLPVVEAAFLSGRLTWTKARLLCRVATPGDEERWVALATAISGARLSKEVRAIDRGCIEACEETDESGAPEEPVERLRIRCDAAVMYKWMTAQELQRRACGERASAAACAELVMAEVLSGLPLEVDQEALPAAARPAPAGDAPLLPAPPTAQQGPDFLAPLLEGLEHAGAHELDRRLRQAGSLERGLLARMGPLVLALATDRLYRDLGFRSLDQYARERLGMSPRKARALLRLERAGCAAPPLRRAWRSGGLGWSQAQTLVPLVLLDGSARHHEAWLARASEVTVRRLQDDVEHAIATGALDPAALPALPAGLPTGAEPKDRRETSLWIVHVPADVGTLFRAALATVQRRLERVTGRPSTPGKALGAMLDHAIDSLREQAGLPPREHLVFERDGWRCVAPGCTSYRNLHAHHVIFRSAGGGDEPSNLVTLCAAHHQRGVHGGLIRISGQAPEALRFEMPLGTYRSGDVATEERRASM